MAEKSPQNQTIFGPQNRKVIACRDWMAEKVPQKKKALELQKVACRDWMAEKVG
jgi:hypothetical protein